MNLKCLFGHKLTDQRSCLRGCGEFHQWKEIKRDIIRDECVPVDYYAQRESNVYYEADVTYECPRCGANRIEKVYG